MHCIKVKVTIIKSQNRYLLLTVLQAFCFFFLALVASTSTFIVPLPFYYTLKEILQGCSCQVVSRWKQKKSEHPDSSILSTAFKPMKVRGWRHHPKLPNQPKRRDHLFFSCENFKQGIIWEKWILCFTPRGMVLRGEYNQVKFKVNFTQVLVRKTHLKWRVIGTSLLRIGQIT